MGEAIDGIPRGARQSVIAQFASTVANVATRIGNGLSSVGYPTGSNQSHRLLDPQFIRMPVGHDFGVSDVAMGNTLNKNMFGISSVWRSLPPWLR
jgi:hypothetical protein